MASASGPSSSEAPIRSKVSESEHSPSHQQQQQRQSLALGISPRGNGDEGGCSRAEEVRSLLDAASSLIHSFISAADSDSDALASGHGLQVPGAGAPRTVLIERHPPHKLASLLDLSVDPPKSPAADLQVGGNAACGAEAAGVNEGTSEDLQPQQRRQRQQMTERREDFSRAAKMLFDYSVNTSSPAFMDKLYSSPSPPGMAADALLSVLNTNAHVFACSPALILIEKFVARELASLFGLTQPLPGTGGKGSSSPLAGGVTVPGGAAANTTAMLVARNVRFPRVKEDGHSAISRPLVVFASEAAHYSVTTAAQTLGLGSRSVRKVPTRPDDSMDTAALERELRTATDAGQIPFFVCATAGTTVRGAYDDLDVIGRLTRRFGAWFHVDACWGGAAAFSPKLRHKLAGSGLADSISFNPHKMLGVPLTCSFLLARDLRTLWASNRLEAGYLFHAADDEEKADLKGVDIDAHATDDAAAHTGSEQQQQQTTGEDRAKRNEEMQGFGGKEHAKWTETKEEEDDDNPGWRDSPWIKSAPTPDTVFDLAQFVPQCGRRPDALKLYMHWRYYGTEGIARHVEASFAGARRVMQLVDESPVLASLVVSSSNNADSENGVGGSGGIRHNGASNEASANSSSPLPVTAAAAAAAAAAAPSSFFSSSSSSSADPPCAQACFYYCGRDGRHGADRRITRAIVARLAQRGWMTDFAPGKNRNEEYLRVVCNRLTTGSVAEGLVKAVAQAGSEVEHELGIV